MREKMSNRQLLSRGYFISLKFSTEFEHLTRCTANAQGHWVKGQGHSVT